jgi:hypothetical protein
MYDIVGGDSDNLLLLHRGPLEWHYLRTKFSDNLTSDSEVISGGQTGDLVSLLSFLESRLEIDFPWGVDSLR